MYFVVEIKGFRKSARTQSEKLSKVLANSENHGKLTFLKIKNLVFRYKIKYFNQKTRFLNLKNLKSLPFHCKSWQFKFFGHGPGNQIYSNGVFSFKSDRVKLLDIVNTNWAMRPEKKRTRNRSRARVMSNCSKKNF